MRESEKQREKLAEKDGIQLEKKDLPALWISGMLTIALPCLLLILLIVGVTLLLFAR